MGKITVILSKVNGDVEFFALGVGTQLRSKKTVDA
jgi:hypothetical protein